MQSAFLGAVRQAFHDANVGADCNFSFNTKSTAFGVTPISQCIVEYQTGNEYIRLDKLIESFRRFGEITLIEYRGRGSNDSIQIGFEFKFEDELHQVIYLLPND
jgi:hypothetical protein